MSREEKDPFIVSVIVVLLGLGCLVWGIVDYDSLVEIPSNYWHRCLFSNLDFIGGRPLVIGVCLFVIYLAIKEIIKNNKDWWES